MKTLILIIAMLILMSGITAGTSYDGIIIKQQNNLQLTTSTPGSYSKSYVSDIDSSTQYYGIYIPNPYNDSIRHAIVFILHGFGGSWSSSFSSTEQSYANANEWIMVKPHGRGNTFYDGIGENDILTVLDELKDDYNIDENRVYIEGCSMGGTGAFRLGIRYPHKFVAYAGDSGWVDYRYWHKHWYANASAPDVPEPLRIPNLLLRSAVDLAENARHNYVHIGAGGADSVVWPNNSINFNAALDNLKSIYGEYEHFFKYNPSAGHCGTYNKGEIFTYFQNKENNPYPKNVTYKTNNAKYGQAYWVQIDRLITQNAMALIEVNISGQSISVSAKNLSQYALFLSSNLLNMSQNITITTNSILSYSGSAKPNITIYAWQNLDEVLDWNTIDSRPGGLLKTASLSGPIADAYTSKFLIVAGTIGSSNEVQQNINEAKNFTSWWNTWMSASITYKNDTEITSIEKQNYNLILYGTNSSNSIIREISSQLPIVMTNDSIIVGDKIYSGLQYGAYFIYPSPYTNKTYVVLKHGTMKYEQSKDLEALPWYWPDYVVYDTTILCNRATGAGLYYLPEAWVDGGYFDLTWALPTTTQITNNIHLEKGWNLISIPLNLTNNSFNHLFNNTNVTVFGYKNNSWFVPEEFETKLGYWVKLNQSLNLTITGTEATETINLTNGWNLVGYPNVDTMQITDSNLKDYLVLAYANNSWLSYAPNRTINTLDKLKPGYGYWVKSNENTSLTIT